jgi:hypothetical protein
VRSLSELAGQDLLWKVQPGSATIPDQAQRSYVLFRGDEPVVQAQVMWKRVVSFDVILEAGEGTFQVHMNLADPARETAVWRTGVNQSMAGFRLHSEELITATGWITTAGGRTLVWEPEHPLGYEYVIFQPGGPRMVTLSAAFSFGINLGTGGNPGHMLIGSEMANDPELPALVAMNFALTNEQVLLVHRPALTQEQLKAAAANPQVAGLSLSLDDLFKLARGKPPDDLIRRLGGKPPGT